MQPRVQQYWTTSHRLIRTKIQRIIEQEQIYKTIAWSYFDGVAIGWPSMGGVIYLSGYNWFKFDASIGPASNNMVELSIILMTMKLALHRKIKHIQVLGDSLLLIDCLNKKIQPKNIYLRPIIDDIISLMELFDKISIDHIFLEQNTQEDCLSKQGLQIEE